MLLGRTVLAALLLLSVPGLTLLVPVRLFFAPLCKRSGKSKRGLSKRGLGLKGANWAKKGPFRAISALPPWLSGAEELVPSGLGKAPALERPQSAPKRPDFPGSISPRFSLKIWELSPRL